MPAPVSVPSVGSPGQGADMFLHIQSARAGKIKGESSTPGHLDDIIVHGWGWGVHAASAIGNTEQLSRRAYKPLTILKRIDRATTGLMSALTTNADIKEAKLTMRRAGGDQQAYYVITLGAARVSRVDHSTDANGNTVEVVEILFAKVEVEYTPQQAIGLRGGATSFTDEIYPDQ
jgi:type VI secretion system secreted protein Hcp